MEFSTSTAPTLLLSIVSDFGIIIGAVLVGILGLLAGLLGLGWGVRKTAELIDSPDFVNGNFYGQSPSTQKNIDREVDAKMRGL